MLGIIFGFISMIGYGMSNSLSKFPVRKIGEVRTAFFRAVFTSVILFTVVIFSSFVLDIKYVLIALIISIFGYLPLYFFYRGLKVADVGVMSPIANSSVVITVLLSVLFFGDMLNIIQIIAIVLIFFGVVLISIDFKKFFFGPGVMFGLIACFFWGLVYFLVKIPVNVIGPMLTAFFLELGTLIVSGFQLGLSNRKFSIPKKMIMPIIIVGIFGATGTLFFMIGIKIAQVSVVASISAANPLVAVLYAKFFLNEKLKVVQYLAAVLIVVGLVFISL